MFEAMEIREITDKEHWEKFLENIEEKTFLQSWSWGEFQREMGNTIWRLGVFDDRRLHALALLVKVQAKRGTFLMVQHAMPMGKGAFAALLEEMKRIGAREGASFIRMAPLWERSRENQEMLRRAGFRASPMHLNAYEASWKLDITPSEDELFRGMRKTTRYLIRQTSNNSDIAVRQSNKKEDMKRFAALNKAVAKRQQFVPFSEAYTEAEFDAFLKDNAVAFFFGTYKGDIVATAFVVFWSGIGFYHQAASLGEYAKYSVPYLVQWEAIREAKRRGCRLYDFWGYVDPKKYPKHPWAGPTLFKMGFGGRAYTYVKTQDYPLSWRYWPAAAFELLRKKRRRL